MRSEYTTPNWTPMYMTHSQVLQFFSTGMPPISSPSCVRVFQKILQIEWHISSPSISAASSLEPATHFAAKLAN